MVELALYQPDIPQNAGTLLRLGACLDFGIHIIHPIGFSLSDKNLRRAGMDYADRARISEHASYAAFTDWRETQGRRLVLLSTKATHSTYETIYHPDDIIMVGRESAGVPDDVRSGANLVLRIPMRPGERSLNVALAAAMIMGEALRQTSGLPGDGFQTEKM